MMAFLIENRGTILVLLIVIAAVIFSIRKMVRDRKKGGCGSCSGCSMSGFCGKH